MLSTSVFANEFSYTEVQETDKIIEFVDPMLNGTKIFAGGHPSFYRENEATVCQYLGLPALSSSDYTVAKTEYLEENEVLAQVKQDRTKIKVKEKVFAPTNSVILEKLYNVTVGVATAGISTKVGSRYNAYFNTIRCLR